MKQETNCPAWLSANLIRHIKMMNKKIRKFLKSFSITEVFFSAVWAGKLNVDCSNNQGNITMFVLNSLARIWKPLWTPVNYADRRRKIQVNSNQFQFTD